MMNDDVRQSNLMAHSPPHSSFLLPPLDDDDVHATKERHLHRTDYYCIYYNTL